MGRTHVFVANLSNDKITWTEGNRQTIEKTIYIDEDAVFEHLDKIYANFGVSRPRMVNLNWKKSQVYQGCYIYLMLSVILGDYMDLSFIEQLKIPNSDQYTLRKEWFNILFNIINFEYVSRTIKVDVWSL